MKDFIGERLTPEWRLSLFNSRLTKRHSDGRVDQRMLEDAKQFAEALENGLGITPPLDAVEIWGKLPKVG
jgi:arylamine N-acetyltransferase